MNQLKMNEFGLSESLESLLAQIGALASTAHFTITSASGSIYTAETAQLLLVIKNLVIEAENYRAEWERLIPRNRNGEGRP